jgi:hypothetical protein
MSVADASLLVTHALPGASSTTVTTSAIDLGLLHGISERPENCELVAEIPALILAKLPNTAVETYTIEACASSGFGSGVKTLASTTQTGATGTATQPAQELRCRLPSDCPRYVRLKVVSDSNGADASAVSATLQVCF